MKREMLLLLRALFLSLSLCLLLLLHLVASEIHLGSRLVAGGENALWVSKNQDFALGFFNAPDLPNRFSIGIRFNSKSIPSDERRVVWVAGAGVSVSDNGSYFELGPDGDLVLFDSSLGVPVWTSKTNRVSVSSALLSDDGNFVLFNDKDEIVWESFDTPADTLLPNQKLKAFEMLRAASESSRSSYYSLHMEGSGRLELRWESSITFWSSGNEEAVKKSEKKIGAVLTPEGALLVAHQDMMTKPVWSVFGEDHNDTVKFRFLRLDRDGNLRMYSFHEESGAWRTVWQAVENQCRVFATCGSQVCSFNGSAPSPQCSCPYNTFASVSNTKCLTPYQKLGCKSGFSMVMFQNMELYGIYPANDSVVSPVSSQRCKKMCSEDPSCTAVTYKNPQCLMKMTRYVSGYSDPSLNSVSYVKTCSDPVAVDPSKREAVGAVTKKSRGVCLSCLVGATSAMFVLFLAFQVGVLVYIYRRKKKEAVKRAERFSKGRSPKGVSVFSVDEIKEMTNDFEDSIGPDMFKGVMSENELVAVKEMEIASIEERKFRSSAAKIGTMHHKNLAKLEGYCCERGKRFLVYEYAKNGCILDHAEKLTWRRRADTWLSVAKALFYLHSECREFVSHGSLNCGNILLGDDFEAKLILYGFGSCAADKDVEDFGKMVLTLVTGRYDEEGGVVVSEGVYREWTEGRGENVVDTRLEGEFDVEELERVLRISFWCVQVDERLRPSMGEVVKVLEGTLSVDPPPLPFVCVRSSPSNSSGSGQSLYESVRE